MRKLFRFCIKVIATICILVIIYLFGILAINTFWDYMPEKQILILDENNTPPGLHAKTHFSVLSWNIGYGAMGQGADFFYDGGEMMRPDLGPFNQYYDGILARLASFDSLDFILVQEVDTASKRSYYTKQFADISAILNGHTGVFAKNYDVCYIPLPFFYPMGRVVSGLAHFSGFTPTNAVLIPFPGNYMWPKNLFMPDRCFMNVSYDLPSGKQLHIINTHNSAFDDGSLRSAQLEFIFEYIVGLYKSGDYVLAGGDWNINPPTYRNQPFLSGDPAFELDFSTSIFDENSQWSIVFDDGYPTNRDVSLAYSPGKTVTTIIDYFICSPNIEALEIKTLYNNFLFSDHQPIYLRFLIK